MGIDYLRTTLSKGVFFAPVLPPSRIEKGKKENFVHVHTENHKVVLKKELC